MPTGDHVVRDVNGWQYLVHVPRSLSGPAPLVVSLHGYMLWAETQKDATQLNARADEFGFIVAYPRAAPWEGPLSGWYWDHTNTTQINFLRQVVADLSAEWCVDADRVYVDGYSNGGSMSQSVACHAPDVFAAASSGGAVDAWATPGECAPTNPIPVYLFCGELEDQRVGGCGPDPAKDPLVRWAARNRCTSQQQQNDALGLLVRRTGCGGGVEVWYREIDGHDHLSLFNDPAAVRAVWTQMWYFFVSQQ